MRISPLPRTALVGVLLAASVAGCGSLQTLQGKERASRLRDQLFTYSKLIRWSEFEAARRFVRLREGSEHVVPEGVGAVRVTHYRVEHTELNPDATEAVVSSTMRFIHRDSGREFAGVDRQVWWWSHDDGRWYLDGGVPDFASLMRARR